MKSRRAIGRVALGIVVVIVIAIGAAAVIFTSSSGTGTGGGAGGHGKMAIMATDPYSSGSATRQYEHYYNEEAHRTNSGGGSSQGGWVKLNASGTLELNTLVNASQTVALKNVSAGTYDSVRFLVDSAIVTYNGQNYTAHMGSGQITAALSGNVQVSSGTTSVILFDLRTVVVNSGSSSGPNFVVTSSARAEVVPSGGVASASLQVGARTDLSASGWFHSFVASSARLVVTAAAISSGSLNVTVKDTGSESSNVTLVIVTPISVSGSGQVVIPAALDASAVFQVGAGGSLKSTNDVLATLASNSGATVTSSTSSTFTYSGTIKFGAGVSALTGVQTGQSYLITVIGDNSVASKTVVAS